MGETIEHRRCAAEFRALDDTGNQIGILQYSVDGGVMNIFRTFVEPEHRGKGVASRMTSAAEDFAKREGLKVVASCSYVASKMK